MTNKIKIEEINFSKDKSNKILVSGRAVVSGKKGKDEEYNINELIDNRIIEKFVKKIEKYIKNSAKRAIKENLIEKE